MSANLEIIIQGQDKTGPVFGNLKSTLGSIGGLLAGAVLVFFGAGSACWRKCRRAARASHTS